MRIIAVQFCILLFLQSFGQTNDITIVPRPVSLQRYEGDFKLSSKTVVIAGRHEMHEAAMLNFYVKRFYGFSFPLGNKAQSESSGSIRLVILKSALRKDAYQIKINARGILITSAGSEGLFYGIQTLLQLLPDSSRSSASSESVIINREFSVPQLSIRDYPRFQYRGMHLDVSRHFFDVDFIKRFLDYMAFQKFNNFHWHLTDDQGWRIEIKKYPRLTAVGGFRNGTLIGRYPGTGNDGIRYGGFYTQEQIKEIVRYAKDRHINVIPEIELPGHASAAIAAYPQLSCFPNEPTEIAPLSPWAGPRNGKEVQQTWGVCNDVYCPSEYTFKFIENVLDEIVNLFPSKYIHIGGDEVPKAAWKRSALCQNLIKVNGLIDEQGLQSYFVRRIAEYLNTKGKKIIGWDEITEGGLAADATVLSRYVSKVGIVAAQSRHDVIMSPSRFCYFDHPESRNEDSVTFGGYLPLDSVYSYEPIPEKLSAEGIKHILGAQGDVWTEYMSNPKKIEYMIFPRMSALSEVLWTPRERRDWPRFSSSIKNIFARYRLWNANYNTACQIAP